MVPIHIPVMIFIIAFTPVIIILTLARKKAKQRKTDLLELSQLYGDEFQEGTWYSVRYASKARFEKIWKLFPWEDYGILSIKKDAITFYSKSNHKVVFPPGQLFLKWIGVKYWPNGIISWFLIRHEQTDHYFTSDTGRWATESGATTKEVFESIEKVLK